MKKCPKCGQSYADKDLNFCLNDGELLAYFTEATPQFSDNRLPNAFADDAPPTVMMNDPRSTNPTGWPGSSAPPVQWQGQPLGSPQANYPLQYSNYSSPDQTLPIVSLCCGIASLTVGWCCSSGLILAPAAMIMGFIAISQAKKNPEKFGGRGLGIGGIVTGALFLAAYLLFILIYGLALIGGGLG